MIDSYIKGKEGEDFVTSLAENSYLKYWCYPNPMDITGDNKEICDLMIVFFDTIILMSVKNYDLNRNYARFQKKVIEKSTKQLFGAQRKLKSRQIFTLNHEIQGKVTINTSSIKNYFNITVSVGENYEHYEFIDRDQKKGTINIFNKETAEIVFQELDTLKDLIEYLKAREDLLHKNYQSKSYCKEKDLLAHYLMNAREFENDFFQDFSTATKKNNGKWNEYKKNRSVILKKLEDEKSYFIDALVRDDVLPLKNGEDLAKEFMSMNRFERRILAKNLFELVEKYENESDFLARRYAVYNGISFLLVYYPIDRSQEEIDLMLLYAQQIYSYFKKSKRLVLLAASKGIKQWKFGLYLPTVVAGKGVDHLNSLLEKSGWLKNEEEIKAFYNEYPQE